MKQIYIHGLGQTPESWDTVIMQMNTAEDSICPNLAEMVKGKETSYQNLYSAFAALCNETDEPLVLCGLSLGGVLALNYAIDYPEKVEKLILLAPQYKMPKKLLRFQNLIFRFMPQSSFEQMGFGKKAFLKLCSTMMELDFTQAIQKVSCPSLIIYGEKDKANKDASIDLAKLMRHATLIELSGVGHEMNIEAPSKLATAVKDFLHT